MEEEIDVVTKEDGEVVKVHFGVERIPDVMLLKEMQQYRDGLNVDRLVAFCALVAFAKVQESNRGYSKRKEHEEEKNLQITNKNSKLFMSPFRNLGGVGSSSSSMKKPRNPFKNHR
jgi:hypothetical protein